MRWWRTGRTDLPTEADRFWAKVDKSAGPDGCWLWTGGINAHGYGQFTRGTTSIKAHRFAYEQLVGPIPDGLPLDHVRERGCTHRHCVNPAHLEPVTPAENNRRSDSPSAINSRKIHCPRGHEFTPENTRILPNGARTCRVCSRAASRRWKAKNKDHLADYMRGWRAAHS